MKKCLLVSNEPVKKRKLFNKAEITGQWREYSGALTVSNKALRRAKRLVEEAL